jgi:hypothetical protein
MNSSSIFSIYSIADLRIIDNKVNFVSLIVDRWNNTYYVIIRCFLADLFVANDVCTCRILSTRFLQCCVRNILSRKFDAWIINQIILIELRCRSRMNFVVVKKINRSESLFDRARISIIFDENNDMISTHLLNERVDEIF